MNDAKVIRHDGVRKRAMDGSATIIATGRDAAPSSSPMPEGHATLPTAATHPATAPHPSLPASRHKTTLKERLRSFFIKPQTEGKIKDAAREPTRPGHQPSHQPSAPPTTTGTPAAAGAAKTTADPAKTPPAAANAASAVKQALKQQREAMRDRKDRREKGRKRQRLQRKSLAEFLEKAGYATDPEQLKRTVFHVVIGAFAIITIVLLVLAASGGAHALDTVLFMLAMWTAVFAFVMLIAWAAIFFYLDYRIYNRTKQLEEVWPDFLQLASSNIAAGMPVDRALWYAIRPNFGVLATEMEEVAKATMAGEDLETSLVRFADKYDSSTIKRSIDILIEGMHAGGEMADLLNKIALNVDEIRIMRKDMAANVTTYAIFITFASIIIAPFLFGLATELLTIIVKITGSLGSASSGSSFFTIKSPGEEAIANFKTFSVLTLLVSTVFSACIVSVIKRGRVMEGIKSIPVYALVAIVIYFISITLLHGLFSSILG